MAPSESRVLSSHWKGGPLHLFKPCLLQETFSPRSSPGRVRNKNPDFSHPAQVTVPAKTNSPSYPYCISWAPGSRSSHRLYSVPSRDGGRSVAWESGCLLAFWRMVETSSPDLKPPWRVQIEGTALPSRDRRRPNHDTPGIWPGANLI